MATRYRNPTRPLASTTFPQSRMKKTTSRPLPSTITNNSKSKGMKTRVEHTTSRNTMYPTSSILKKKPLTRRYTERSIDHVLQWPEPSDLESVKPRRFYSPIHTPPRLRTLITPPGIEPYRHYQNLRGVRSPLPGLTNWHSAPTQLETWGVNPTDYNSTLNLMRRYPSPLTRYGLGSSFNRPMKPYIVVPRLTSFISPPVSSGDPDFTYRSRRLSPIYVPDARYTYHDRVDSFPSTRFHREPSDYVFVRKNEAFANSYIEEFIGRSIEDQFLPDILLELILELEQESKNRGGKSHQRALNQLNMDLNQRIRRGHTTETHLFSDEWMNELDHQTTSAPTFQHSDYSTQASSRLRYNDLPPDVQGRILADVNQELIDYNTQRVVADLSTQPSSNRSTHVSVRNGHRHDVETDNVLERRYNTQRIDQTQHDAMENYAQNRFLDTVHLDELLRNYHRRTDSNVDVDGLSQLLDASVLGNLVNQYQTIDGNRSRTSENYGAKKFHLNSFMNITMELLLTELSGSLIEDMKDLDIHERKTLPFIALI